MPGNANLSEAQREEVGRIFEAMKSQAISVGKLIVEAEGALDTLFASGWGRTDLPGGNAEMMVDSLARLSTMDPGLTVLPGHGPETTIGREQPWLQSVAQDRKLPF